MPLKRDDITISLLLKIQTNVLYPEYIVPWTIEVKQGYINLTFIRWYDAVGRAVQLPAQTKYRVYIVQENVQSCLHNNMITAVLLDSGTCRDHRRLL